MQNILNMNKKAQVANIVIGIVAVIIAVIMMVGILIPITTNVTGSQGFTGVNATISNNLVTFILIAVLVLIASLAIAGFRRQ